jgi:hypothetical protein
MELRTPNRNREREPEHEPGTWNLEHGTVLVHTWFSSFRLVHAWFSSFRLVHVWFNCSIQFAIQLPITP